MALPNFSNQNAQPEVPFGGEESTPPFTQGSESTQSPEIPQDMNQKFPPIAPPVEEIATPPSIPQQEQIELPTESVSPPVAQTTQSTQQMPSQVDAYRPLETQAHIAEISPGKFDNLTKVLDLLKQNKPTTLTIKGSYIFEGVSGAIIVADVKQIFDGKEIDFQITDPKKHVDLFKQFKGNNNIFILDDPENTRFILTNGPIKIFLPKQVDQLVAQTSAPDTSNATSICSKNVGKDVRDEIKGLGRHSNAIEYLIQDNSIKAMHIPDTGIYRFEEFIKDPGVAKLDETNADLVLKSELFLPVDSDNYSITICKLPTGEYLSITECNSGLIKMWIFEQLEETTGGNLNF
jgi:hypothetical protein